MNRRTFLGASVGLAGGLAGCLSSSTDDDSSRFDTLRVGGVTVPLVPIDIAIDWYDPDDPRFVDARGLGQYQRSHVKGAVSSPARAVEDWSRPRPEDPTATWSKDERIVTYCTCPHHLSSLRAGEFITHGYENVYALDEGFGAWLERGYPTTGAQSRGPASIIRGRTDPGDAGEYAWAVQEASRQQEAVPIRPDGRYRLELHFGGLDPATPIHLWTPSYELTAPLSDLTSSLVTGPSNT